MVTVTGTYPVHYKAQGWELTGAIADKLVSKNLWKYTAQTQGLEPSERTAWEEERGPWSFTHQKQDITNLFLDPTPV